MRRWYLSAAALLGLAASAAQAQYLLIRVYVGGGAKGEEVAGGGAGASRRPGGGSDVGGPGMGLPGSPGAAAGGGGGAFAGGRPGAAGGGAGFPAPGAAGGGVGFPGGGRGAGGGFPGAAGAGRAGAGMTGPGMAGMAGMMGGMAGMAGPGAGPMGMGGMMGGAGAQPAEVTFDTYESYVMVAVELTDKALHRNDQLGFSQYRHAWGATGPYSDDVNIIAQTIPYKSPRKKFEDDRRKLNNKKDKTADEYLSLARDALRHGLVNECLQVMDELVKASPAGLTGRGKDVVEKYKQVREALARPAAPGAAVDEWKRRLSNFTAVPSKEGHYVLFYAGQSPTIPSDVQRRLDLLEQNMRAVYTWFALENVALKVPEEKLVAVLVPDPTTFRLQRAALGLPAGVSDGFFAPRDNVAVFSSERQDEAYKIFAQHFKNKVLQQGLTLELLLAGKERPRGFKKGKEGNDQLKEYQTLALVYKALEYEAEMAAVSHEGTRQLAVAADLIPRAVAAPEWINFGFASLFDTPKGPYPGALGTAKVALWHAYGAPSWAYLRPFRIWAASKDPLTRLDEPAEALKRTVTDFYFQAARKEVKDDLDPNLTESERKKKEKEIARAKEEQLRARAQAWALTYFLAQDYLVDLMGYFKALAELPRDMELDEQTMLLTFARAFKLTNADGNTVDEGKLSVLATKWFAKIESAERPGPDDPLTKRQQPSQGDGGAGGQGPGGGNKGGGPSGT